MAWVPIRVRYRSIRVSDVWDQRFQLHYVGTEVRTVDLRLN